MIAKTTLGSFHESQHQIKQGSFSRAKIAFLSFLRALVPAALLLATAVPGSAADRLAFRHVSLDLPGAPVDVIPSDLDGDGRQDLLVVVARTFWGQTGTDRIEGLVQITEVVPALFDRREAHAFLQGPNGLFQRAGSPFPLPPSILSLEAGPPSHPIVVLTDEGISTLRVTAVSEEGTSGTSTSHDLHLDAAGREKHLDGISKASSCGSAASTCSVSLQPLISDRPVLSGSRTLVSHLGLIRDIDGDGTQDLMLPARDGFAVYRGVAGGFSPTASARLPLPGDERRSGSRSSRRFPLPRMEDVDGDHLTDLVVLDTRSGETAVSVLRGQGAGRFSPPKRIDLAPLQMKTHIPAGAFEPRASKGSSTNASGTRGAKAPADGEVGGDDEEGFVFFGDIDGDGLAEAVSKTSIDTGKGELKQAKEPHYRYRFHRVSRALAIDPVPYYQTEVIGHGFDIDLGEMQVTEFQDLDGDGRKDLVTISLDFSLFQIIRVMATKRIGIGLDFHLWHQERDGSFLPVPKLDLSETLRVDLNDLKLERLAQFAGDFDGDGRADFVHLGRGKTVTIHRGQAGCRYPSAPDLTLVLEEEALDLGLVRIADFDGDGRSDLAITRGTIRGRPPRRFSTCT